MSAQCKSAAQWLRAPQTWCAAVLLSAAVASASAASVRLEQLPQAWREDDSRALDLSTLGGHRVILTMAYANCRRLCPMTIAQFERMQTALDRRGEQATFVVVGYDPENEPPADWRAYRRSHHLLRGNWHFLTGSRRDTEQLARQLGFEFWKYDEHVMHGMRALIFDERGAPQKELGPEITDWTGAL